MFEIGDYVVNANNGICKIEDTVTMNMAGTPKGKLYYMLVPMDEKNAKIYIPVDKAEERCRRVSDEEEVLAYIDKIPEIEEEDITFDRDREQHYKEVIQSCDIEKMIGIIKNMYRRKQTRSHQGKKNTAMDERYFKQAERNLHAEFAFALGKKPDEIKKIIADRVKHLEKAAN